MRANFITNVEINDLLYIKKTIETSRCSSDETFTVSSARMLGKRRAVKVRNRSAGNTNVFPMLEAMDGLFNWEDLWNYHDRAIAKRRGNGNTRSVTRTRHCYVRKCPGKVRANLWEKDFSRTDRKDNGEIIKGAAELTNEIMKDTLTSDANGLFCLRSIFVQKLACPVLSSVLRPICGLTIMMGDFSIKLAKFLLLILHSAK